MKEREYTDEGINNLRVGIVMQAVKEYKSALRRCTRLDAEIKQLTEKKEAYESFTDEKDILNSASDYRRVSGKLQSAIKKKWYANTNKESLEHFFTGPDLKFWVDLDGNDIIRRCRESVSAENNAN